MKTLSLLFLGFVTTTQVAFSINPACFNVANTWRLANTNTYLHIQNGFPNTLTGYFQTGNSEQHRLVDGRCGTDTSGRVLVTFTTDNFRGSRHYFSGEFTGNEMAGYGYHFNENGSVSSWPWQAIH